MDAPTIVYDGLCRFCNGWVQFVLKRDRKGVFRFAAAQSAAGAALMTRHGLSADDLQTILFVKDGVAYMKSTASLQILMTLGGIWRLAGMFLVVPRVIRDGVYGFVARNRVRIGGRYKACPVPPPEKRSQFLA